MGGNAVLIACVLTTVLSTLTAQTSAQLAKIGTVYDVKGAATVAHQAAGPRSPAVTDDVFVQDTITTASDSHVTIGFTAGALVQLREHSLMTILERVDRPVVNLENGVIYYRVSREGDRRDEAHVVLTPNATARTTGDLVVKVDRALDTALATTVCVLDGIGFASAIGGAEVRITKRTCVTVTGSTLGTVFSLPPLPPMPMLKPLPFCC